MLFRSHLYNGQDEQERDDVEDPAPYHGVDPSSEIIGAEIHLKRIKAGRLCLGRLLNVGAAVSQFRCADAGNSAVGERVLTPGLVPYSATKGGVKMFTQGLSREVGPRGITVNNVQPGPIDTDMNPAKGDWAVPQKAVTALNRYGHVDDIAAMWHSSPVRKRLTSLART
jgi:NAD(P)-dependent dehydrogenase (short-subunit alcohol dehydrogenase family)